MENQIERQKLKVDIVGVGFGPAMGGFLTTLNSKLLKSDGTLNLESRTMPGMPPQIICYERADDVSSGVSGVVTKADAIQGSIPPDEIKQIPMSTPVTEERLLYLVDPYGASRRSFLLKSADLIFKNFGKILPYYKHYAFRIPWIPSFLHKKGGMIFSIGQFNQWVANQLMNSGLMQIWPGTPVKKAIIDDGKVIGVQLLDQGVDKNGIPTDAYMPGMDIEAALTVIADGAVGAVGRQLDDQFGLPHGHEQNDWAIGMKMVVELPEGTNLKEGTVFHTFGYPEPEIFGFMYIHPGNIASLGIFVPSWFKSPIRTAYRYMQYWIKHPYIWQYLCGGKMRSWGAKTLQESGCRGEPYLVGDGYARIGEGSGSTNTLTNSGVDEAWQTGVILAESVIEIFQNGKEFNKKNLEDTYVRRRKQSKLEMASQTARKSRDGFHRGFVSGLIGMALTGFTSGKINFPDTNYELWRCLPTLAKFFKGKISIEKIKDVRKQCAIKGIYSNDILLEMAGWPHIEYDGKLLISHQDALLMGGKVQAPNGVADHVVFSDTEICKTCESKICTEVCSGQAIYPGEDGIPHFDREKCIHCGACFWNCPYPDRNTPSLTNLKFMAGAGGLHSAEN